MKFNNVEITQETILTTRQWFIDNNKACIAEAKSGEVFVNDLDSYIAWKEQNSKVIASGDADYSFTFLQRAYYIQTGESVALLG